MYHVVKSQMNGMDVDKIIEQSAKLSALELSGNERNQFREEFKTIIKLMDEIEKAGIPEKFQNSSDERATTLRDEDAAGIESKKLPPEYKSPKVKDINE